MYYKVMKDDVIVDVLDQVVYLKYQAKHNRMVLCDELEAQAIFSSDGGSIWHEISLRMIPIDGYETVRLEEINEFEYKRLKALNCGTKEDVMDELVYSLINGDTSLFSDSLKRLYSRKDIDENMVAKLCEEYDIAKDEKLNILK